MTRHLEIPIKTSQREQLIDITGPVRQALKSLDLDSGIVHIYCRHTTAGVMIQENADPDLKIDLIEAFAGLAPRTGWRHREGNADAHIKASMVGTSATVPVDGGRMLLGTWQSVYFAEFDGPRQRTCVITALGATG